MATRCSSRSCSASAPAVSTPVSSSLPYGRRGRKRVLYSEAAGESASLLCSHQFPWLRTSRVKAVSSISSQFHCILNLSTAVVEKSCSLPETPDAEDQSAWRLCLTSCPRLLLSVVPPDQVLARCDEVPRR